MPKVSFYFLKNCCFCILPGDLLFSLEIRTDFIPHETFTCAPLIGCKLAEIKKTKKQKKRLTLLHRLGCDATLTLMKHAVRDMFRCLVYTSGDSAHVGEVAALQGRLCLHRYFVFVWIAGGRLSTKREVCRFCSTGCKKRVVHSSFYLSCLCFLRGKSLKNMYDEKYMFRCKIKHYLRRRRKPCR